MRYNHRIAIANSRLVAVTDDRVTFRWRDYAHGNKRRTMTMKVHEFLRRFLLHVLPASFVRIRYFGFLANRHRRELLNLCRSLLHAAVSMSLPITAVYRCRTCEHGTMRLVQHLPLRTCATAG